MLINPHNSCLLVIDIQERMHPVIDQADALLTHAIWLIEVAQTLSIPTLISEQYPKGLGHTVSDIQSLLPASSVMEKIHFSCVADEGCSRLLDERFDQFVIVGAETHVCVLQTAIELKMRGKDVFIVEEAVGSRNPRDKALALERFRQCGIFIVSREMVAFEWMRKAGTDQFRHISKTFIR